MSLFNKEELVSKWDKIHPTNRWLDDYGNLFSTALNERLNRLRKEGASANELRSETVKFSDLFFKTYAEICLTSPLLKDLDEESQMDIISSTWNMAIKVAITGNRELV